MPLPARIDYALPPAAYAVPSGRCLRALDPARAVLLVHDLQQYFTRVYAPHCAAYRTALAATARLQSAARAAGVPVVFTAQPGDQEPRSRGLMTPVWGPGITSAAEDLAIVADVAPLPGEPVLVKHRYSAFVRSDLEDMLRGWGRDQLVITGIYGHIGVLATATDAFMRDVEPFVVADAVADFSAADHERTLAVAASIGATVLDAATALAPLTPLAPDQQAADGWGPWAPWMADSLTRALGGDGEAERLAADLVAHPDRDVFEAGLDSLRCFQLLDDLADVGVELDFTELVERGTLRVVQERLASARVAAPAGSDA